MKMENHTVEKLLLTTPGVFNYSPDKLVEVKPGIFSPIYINLKYTFPDFVARRVMVNRLIGSMGDQEEEFDAVCGVESGGTYHAAAVADALLKPVVFLRKAIKNYGVVDRIVGQFPNKGSRIAMVDDVLATGGTVKDAVRYFKERDTDIHLYTIFSYGHEYEISHRLQVPITALSTFSSLMEIAEHRGVVVKQDVAFLTAHVNSYKDRIIEQQIYG